jgi:hypothetical protein
MFHSKCHGRKPVGIYLIEINGQRNKPEEVKGMNILAKNDRLWEFIFRDESTIDATRNVMVKNI